MVQGSCLLNLVFTDADNNPHPLSLVSYRIPSGFTPVLSSHGNSLENKPFFPTWPSTLQRIKEEGVTGGPKATVELLSHEVGGVLGATAPGQLPRNEKQVVNLKSKRCSSSAAADDLFAVMQDAHTQDPNNRFVRDIKTAEP